MFNRFLKNPKISLGFGFIVFVFAVISQIQVAQAASLSFLPSSTKVLVGNIFSVKIAVNTQGKAVNNSEIQVLYPTDTLEILSVSKSSSIFTLWVEEPKFSNTAGSVTLNGGVPNPGYTGANGEIVSIVFRAKKQGTASLMFGDSAVRQNDGLGTDILASKNSTTIEIKPNDNAEVAPPPILEGAPKAPIIVSASHPISGKWYNNSNVDLMWEVASDVISVSTLISNSPNSIPTVIYSPPIANKKISKLEDGVWYFHVQLKNQIGWGAVGHFRIQVDTVPPNPFKITYPAGTLSQEPRKPILFHTNDSLSGVGSYEVKIGEGQFMIVDPKSISSKPYLAPDLDPGQYNILVKAVDLAGNETIQASQFKIESIMMPILEDFPSELNADDTLRIHGTAYPNSDVEIHITDFENKVSIQMTRTQANGNFSLVWPKKLNPGSYSLTLRAVDDRGAKSEFTKSLSFTVRKSKLTSVGSLVLNWLSLIILIIILIGVIVLIVLYFIWQAKKIRRSMRYKIHLAESSVSKSFDQLKDEILEQVKILEDVESKRELTKEEVQIVERLQNSLNKAEINIEKQLEEIDNPSKK